MLGLGEVRFAAAQPAGSAALVFKQHEVYAELPLGDVGAERQRLQSELDYTLGFLRSVEAKLSNEKFVANAKPDVLARERQKQADAEAKRRALEASLAALG